MKILSVISALNFPRFTRRATIEAISRQVEQLDLLIYTSIKNKFNQKTSVNGIQKSVYHFWVPDVLKNKSILIGAEYLVRTRKWKKVFSKYDVVFFTDPNQFYLLPYITHQKVVYLIRDPNVLQHEKYYYFERKLLERADMVLATSKNLANEYVRKYHGMSDKYVYYWPNCVDLRTWDIDRLEENKITDEKCIIGMAGNINDRTSIELLEYLTTNTNYTYQLCGNIFLKDLERQKLNLILERGNVKHLGYIAFEELPNIINQWSVGITIEGFNDYTRYTHHNKIYQYLALGIPAVTLKIHDDYEKLSPYVQSVENYKEYISALEAALMYNRDKYFRERCIEIAKENSADKRAEMFLKWVKSL